MCSQYALIRVYEYLSWDIRVDAIYMRINYESVLLVVRYIVCSTYLCSDVDHAYGIAGQLAYHYECCYGMLTIRNVAIGRFICMVSQFSLNFAKS